MKKYIQPSIKVKKIVLDGEMMAASPGTTVPSDTPRSDVEISSEDEFEAKDAPSSNLWDE